MVLEEAGRAPAQAPAPLRILHEDDWLLAVDKPAGMPSQATPAGDVGTLPHAVALHLGVPIREVATVHRLDKATSGVVAFGKRPSATRALAAAFREQRVERCYVAVVAGDLRGSGTIDAALGPSNGPGHRQRVRADGSPARTDWEAVAALEGASALVLRPHTGRTHQLRVHLSHIGHPILGDRLYGGPERAGPLHARRLLLHAWKLVLPHPDGALELVAPLPPDFPRDLFA